MENEICSEQSVDLQQLERQCHSATVAVIDRDLAQVTWIDRASACVHVSLRHVTQLCRQ